MQNLYVMVGIPGSGKSTYAKEMVAKDSNVIHISADEIREQVTAETGTRDEKKTFNKVRQLITQNLKEGHDVICDATNVTLDKRASYLDEACCGDAKKIALWVKRDVKTCIEQNDKREGAAKVPNVAIYSLNKRFVEPTLDEGFDEIRIV